MNDKREKTTILGTLETKLNELIKKIQTNRKNLDNINEQIRSTPQISSNAQTLEKHYRNMDKLKQLDQLYESQHDKLQKQIEYIRLSLHIESLTNRPNPALVMQDMPYIQSLSNQLNEMYLYMKNENKLYLKKQQQSADGDTSGSSNALVKNSSFSGLSMFMDREAPMKRIHSLYEKVNSALAALLAHIAATAHSSAAMYAYNYQYYQYYQQINQNGSSDILPPIKPVPLKEDIEKASSAFAKFKSKISTFFLASEQLEKSSSKLTNSKKKSEMTGLNKLIADYSDDSNDSLYLNGKLDDNQIEEDVDDEIKLMNIVNTLKKSNEIKNQLTSGKKLLNGNKKEVNGHDSSDDEEEYEDLEIVTTSEIKSGLYEKINYLLPSLKATYFPLMSSLNQKDYHFNNVQIAVEKSSSALTLLGPNNHNSQRKIKLSDILYGKN